MLIILTSYALMSSFSYIFLSCYVLGSSHKSSGFSRDRVVPAFTLDSAEQLVASIAITRGSRFRKNFPKVSSAVYCVG